MSLSQEDRRRISDAVRLIEDRTSGEIVCVLAESSTSATMLPLFIAALAALAVPWILVVLTVLSVPRLRARLLPARVRRQMGYRAAREQFIVRGIERKKDRCGILIFVSVAERYARIVADDGIAARVPQAHWQAAVNVLISHVREGRVAEGFVAAIELCGTELTKHFPRHGEKREELPDRIYLI